MSKGRNTGSRSCNPIALIHRIMKSRGMIPNNMAATELSNILRTVGDCAWDLVYAGHNVAIPGLFNMEIRPNSIKWPRRVDWKRTMKLWEEDEEAKKDKLLVRSIPTDKYLRIKHSTIGSRRSWWYYPLMMEVRPCKGKMRQIDHKYTL